MTVVAVVLIASGLFFLAVSAWGLVRFPDFYTRAHVVAKSETFGIVLVIAGVIVHHEFGEGTTRLVLLLLFSAIANPTAIHALARASYMEDGASADALYFPTEDSDSDRAGARERGGSPAGAVTGEAAPSGAAPGADPGRAEPGDAASGEQRDGRHRR
jgi:multicomponent Na+:H+ antiporter subunit G